MLLFTLLLACGSPETAPPPEPAPEVASEAAQAEAAAKKLGGTLKARMVEAMGSGGPGAAITVCADEAQGLTAQIADETGVRVGRSSSRLRNPANAGPDWVTAWLRAQGERPAEGVAPLREIVDGRARVILPIAVEAPCLVCHGAPQAIPVDVREVLAARYPDDDATGYAVGDLRGALWAEVSSAPPERGGGPEGPRSGR